MNQSQKSRLESVAEAKEYFVNFGDRFEVTGRISRLEIDIVTQILSNMKEGKKGRFGKRERTLIKTAKSLLQSVNDRRKLIDTSGDDKQMYTCATGTWKVLIEQVLPIN